MVEESPAAWGREIKHSKVALVLAAAASSVRPAQVLGQGLHSPVLLGIHQVHNVCLDTPQLQEGNAN